MSGAFAQLCFQPLPETLEQRIVCLIGQEAKELIAGTRRVALIKLVDFADDQPLLLEVCVI